jgi:DNA-binding transcriptional regulator YdaS (Cro superfamily)
MKKPRPETVALLHAVDRLGGQTSTAKKLGISQQAVQFWIKQGRVPPLRVLALEAASGVSRKALRPDMYP